MATGSEPISAENLGAVLAAFKSQLDAEREEISNTFLSVSKNTKTGGTGITWTNNSSSPKRITFTTAGVYTYSMTLVTTYAQQVTVSVSNSGTILSERFDGTRTVSGRISANSGTYISIDWNYSWGIEVSCEVSRIS